MVNKRCSKKSRFRSSNGMRLTTSTPRSYYCNTWSFGLCIQIYSICDLCDHWPWRRYSLCWVLSGFQCFPCVTHLPVVLLKRKMKLGAYCHRFMASLTPIVPRLRLATSFHFFVIPVFAPKLFYYTHIESDWTFFALLLNKHSLTVDFLYRYLE